MSDASSRIHVPESFRGRPYASEQYQRIASWALRNHAFYQALVTEPGQPFPVLTRLMVQHSNRLLLNGHPSNARTSGSISIPVEVAWSPERTLLERKDTAMFVKWLGGPMPPMKIVALAAHPKNDQTIDVVEPIPTQVEFMQERFRVEGACSLITYPSNLEMLCRHVIENGIDMSFLRRCTCLSESYEPFHDQLLAQAFPNAVASCTYSSVEFGLIAARCPHNPDNYHIMAHKVGVEFLDPDGNPCRDGEPGEVVVTDYSNRRSTLIRYSLGDFAAPAQCDCGKIRLPAMTNIIGKVRGMLKRADGRSVMFTGLSPMFRDSLEIRQFQVVQPAIGSFVVHYVPRPGADIEAFMVRVRDRFSVDFGTAAEVQFQAHESIPRSAGGKYYASICLVGDAPDVRNPLPA